MKTRLCSNRKLKQMLSQMIPASSLGKSQPRLGPENTHGQIPVHITFHTKNSRLQTFDHLYSKIHLANSLVYARLKNNNKDMAKESVQNNQLLSSGHFTDFQYLLILPLVCRTHKQLLSEFKPNPDFIKETFMAGQFLIIFDGAGQTQQLDQPAAVHLQLVDVATRKNLDKTTIRTTKKFTQVFNIVIPNKYLHICALY